MSGFPDDTPRKSDVDQGLERIRDDMERFYIDRRLFEIQREARDRGEYSQGGRWSQALDRAVPEELDETACQQIKDDSVSQVTAEYDYLESVYATFFDGDQQAQLEHMIGKYVGFYAELDALASSPSIRHLDELLEGWDEAAAVPFQEEFRAPLPGALVRHRDLVGHLLAALEMEAAAQVKLRRAFAEFPGATRSIMGGGGQLSLAHFSIGTAIAALVIPPANTVLSLMGLGASLLAEVEQRTTVSFKMEERSNASFLDLTSEMNKGIELIADSLDTAREKAVETLRSSMESLGLDLERYRTMPNHYVPGGALLD
ncbi:hypothetical protein GCM10009853_032380 [Glycomyces scopariae]